MTTAALNNLLTYILSLGLSQRNRKWLAERILEPETKTSDSLEPKAKMTEEEFYAKLDASIANTDKGQVIAMKEDESGEEFINRLLAGGV